MTLSYSENIYTVHRYIREGWLFHKNAAVILEL